jgi:hypothetical protein
VPFFFLSASARVEQNFQRISPRLKISARKNNATKIFNIFQNDAQPHTQSLVDAASSSAQNASTSRSCEQGIGRARKISDLKNFEVSCPRDTSCAAEGPVLL